MATLNTDPQLEKSLIQQRQAWGADHYDEVWEGVYMMAPNPNNEHQQIISRLVFILEDVVGVSGSGTVLPGTNVARIGGDWTKDYRCPDVAVFLRDTQAVDCDTHWQGPADFLVEIVSPGDATREKLPFYEEIGVRELLIVDRNPWALELYRHLGQHLALAGRSVVAQEPPGAGDRLASQVVPLAFQLLPAQPRPQIGVTHPAAGRQWVM